QFGGYEIRHGRSVQHPALPAATVALRNAEGEAIGWQQGSVLGLYAHGLFESTEVLRALFGARVRGLEAVFDGLADFVDRHFEPGALMRLLADRNIALCISDHHDAPSPWERTGDFVYVRGHGPGGRYKGHYSPQTLRDWAADFLTWKRRGFDVYAYFDNDQKSAAPADALRWKQLL
ncbi:MAG: DUF72 domain-containing protein, partial [Rhizobiales bacterium]|nr:DUF72 domain-containing protein [Hyphomicrobiales bacterium]